MITDELGHVLEREPVPPLRNALYRPCGCIFVLKDESPEWFKVCREHSHALALQYRIVRRNIAQQVLDER